MTINEAIKVINPDDHDPGAVEILNRFDDLSEGIREAHRVVIAALRAQQTTTKLDRKRWEGCWNCNNLNIRKLTLRSGREYCPGCGKPLTCKAWAELERRMTGSHATAELHNES